MDLNEQSDLGLSRLHTLLQDLMIQTDGLDKKALEVSDHIDCSALEQGAVGNSPITDGQTKLDIVPKEEEEQAEQELRTWIEEEKYRLYLWSTTVQKKVTQNTETDGYDYPFLD